MSAQAFTLLDHAPGPDNPLAMLRACHHRLEAKLDTLARVVEVYEQQDLERYDQAAGAIGMVLRHMHTAARQHTEDEEFSLFPRLVAAEPAMGARLMALEAEHEQLEGRLEALEPTLVALGEGHDPSPAVVRALVEQVPPFVADYRKHLRHEEAVIFAAAQRLLSPAELSAIGEEMAGRRALV